MTISLLVTTIAALIAVPKWRWRSEETAHAANAAAAQAPGQWIPFADVPFLVSGTAVTTPESYRTYSSGRVSSIAVDPRDQSRWLAGGNGGLWETRDSGVTWAPITDDAPTLATGAVAFAPSNPDVIYAATGEPGPYTSVAHVGEGLLKSTNNGQTWVLLAQTEMARASVRRIRVDPNNANTLTVTVARGAYGRDSALNGAPAPPPYGILRSTDGGTSWTRTLNGIATALEVDPANFSRQYAAISVAGSPGNGLYRSTNGGVSWSPVRGPWWPNLGDLSASGRIELAIAPSNPDVVYASFSTSIPSGLANLLGLYKTENAWAETPTWLQVPTQATGTGGYCGEVPDEAGKCGYSHVISVDPRDPNTLFAGGQRNLWRCNNCGASPTWTNVTEARQQVFVHVDFHDMAWAGNRLLVGNDGGVYSTTNFGATWQSHNRELKTTMFYSGALHPKDLSFVMGGARDYSIAIHRAATGWRISPVDGWGEADVAISSTRFDTDWMGANTYGKIRRTTNGGLTTIAADTGIDRNGAALVSPVRKCASNDDIFVTGTMQMWRSTNFFSSTSPSWTLNGPTESSSILSIAYGDTSCNVYAYGTRNGDVRLTRDAGTTWNDLDPSKSLPARSINGLAFDPSNPNRLFAVASSYDVATPVKPGHIFRTDNALSASPTWTRVGPPNQPFADVPFNVVAVDPNNTQLIYAGSDSGLWQSVDGGTTWVKVGRGSGLPPVTVHDIQFSGGRTVIFTYGRGAFELVK